MMKNQILFLVPLFLGFNLAAADTKDMAIPEGFHAPAMTEDIRSLLIAHAKHENAGILSNAMDGAERGFNRPLNAAHEFHNKVFEDTKKSTNTGELVLGAAASLATGLGGFLVGLVAALPGAAVGTLIGFKNGVVESIGYGVKESISEQTIALHLYQWMHAISIGRTELRARIKTWQENNNATSIKDALVDMIQRGQLAKYFAETKINQAEMIKSLKAIPQNKDNMKDFFNTLSEIVRIPGITTAQYSNLVNTLVNWGSKTASFPSVSAQEIQQNIYFALYFFSIVTNDQLKIINSFMKNTQKQ